MVEHWSEKPGVDSSILSLGISLFPPGGFFYVFLPLSYEKSPPVTRRGDFHCFKQIRRTVRYISVRLENL